MRTFVSLSRLLQLAGLVVSCHVAVLNAEPLPVPLTLFDALSVTEKNSHPDLLLQIAKKESAQADIEQAEANYAFDATFNLQARRIDPSDTSINAETNDSKASINLKKPIYDFGYTSERILAAKASYSASQLNLVYAHKKQQIDVAKKYFDALLADLEFVWKNEAMSIAFVGLDKMRDRYELKQVSEIDLLLAESNYQKFFTRRKAVELSQYTTRVLLAESMDRAGELSSDLIRPDFSVARKKLPDPNDLISIAQTNNIQLQAQRKVVASAFSLRNAESKKFRPQLDAEFEVSEYSRQLSNRDNWSASINLHVPLYENSLLSSGKAKTHAVWKQEKAQLKLLELNTRKHIYDYWLKLNNLISQREALKVAGKYAERLLDKSRGEYELELKTDFGQALVATSKYQYDITKNEFEIVIANMQLALLLGNEPIQVLLEAGGEKK